mmetsp:Transcript_42602/g.100039  ORF Transcript_42602/g.100039 Transcript_42602/m.100039 type:complete len:162 (-) Transcript_42602:125-610(-)
MSGGAHVLSTLAQSVGECIGVQMACSGRFTASFTRMHGICAQSLLLECSERGRSYLPLQQKRDQLALGLSFNVCPPPGFCADPDAAPPLPALNNLPALLASPTDIFIRLSAAVVLSPANELALPKSLRLVKLVVGPAFKLENDADLETSPRDLVLSPRLKR